MPLRSIAPAIWLELVLDRCVVGAERRGDVHAEEPRPNAPEATQRPEATTLGGGNRDRLAPVGRDAEL